MLDKILCEGMKLCFITPISFLFQSTFAQRPCIQFQGNQGVSIRLVKSNLCNCEALQYGNDLSAVFFPCK